MELEVSTDKIDDASLLHELLNAGHICKKNMFCDYSILLGSGINTI